jgi:NAD(P)-dependent dehydrogenase (short-subunit alcohol dehydrogenase family)
MSSSKWSVEDMPSLTGKIVIVTGGNSGLGFQAVKAYATKNAGVVMACRSVNKGNLAKAEILKSIPMAKIEVMELDLMSLNSVREFVSVFIAKYKRLDILLNNAGIMMVPYQLTKDGIESQQGTNHFGHFALTGLLFDLLKSTPASRVVNVSSLAHKQGSMDFENLLYEAGKGYSPMAAYGRSKLENLLFTFELQRFFDANKLDIKAVVAHPGVSDTNLFSNIGGKFLQTLLKPLFSLFIQPASMGVLPELRASVEPNIKGAEYFGPAGNSEMKGYPVIVKPNIAAQNTEDALKLWQVSESLTQVYFK